jgi:hypothetical protein
MNKGRPLVLVLRREGPLASPPRRYWKGSEPELARRVVAFQAQIEAWTRSGRPGPVPLLALPGAPPPQEGRCWSCGEPVPDGRWRCGPCLRAVYVALGMEPPEDISRRREKGAP